MFRVFLINFGFFLQDYYEDFESAKEKGIETGFEFAIYDYDKIVYPH